MVQQNWKVLLIDDDEEDYLLTRMFLRQSKGRKIEVEWAPTYEAAQNHIQKNGFDVLLVDYDLGARTGIELIREITASGYHAPAILYTGRGSYEVDLEAMEAGATLYLSKSEANPLLLERAIRYAIELKQKEQELQQANERLEQELFERKRAEEELRASEEKFAKAFRASPDALILSRQADGYIQEVNPAFEQLFGFSRAEVIGKTSLDLNMFVHPADRQQVVELLRAQGTVRDYEVEIRTKSGQTHRVSLSVEWIEIQGEPHMITSVRDITERKQAEEALQQSEAQLRELARSLELDHNRLTAVLENLPVGVWIADENGQLIGKNQAADRIWAGDAPLVEGVSEYVQYTAWTADSGELLAPEDYPMARALQTGQPVAPVELRVRRFDGSEGFVLVSAALIKDSEGRLAGSIGTNVDITESKQVERALRESETRLRLALDAARMVAWEYDPATLKVTFSENAEEVLELPQRHENSNQGYGLIHPDDVERHRKLVTEAIATGGSYVSIYRHHHDEKMIWLEEHGRSVVDSSGNTTRLVGVVQNITERKQAEEALRNSEERYRQLADAMPQLVWTAQPDGTVDYYNQRYQFFGGIAPVEGNRWEWGPVLHPDDLQPTVDAWNEAVKTGNVYQIEHRVRMADGSYRWHLSRGIPAYDAQGRLAKWYGTATDIHDFKEIQVTLQQREQRLRTLFESSLIGIVIREPSGKILEANQAYLDITGLTADEIKRGQVNIADITPPEYSPADQQCNEQVLTQGYCRPYEKEYIRKDGTRVPVQVGYSLFEGDQLEFVGYILDLSELKRAQVELASYAEQLKSSNQELENFAFIASHDLQEPLRKILMFGEQIAARNAPNLDEVSQDYLERMKNAAERMQGMITGLLDLSRINTRGSEFETVNLTDVANEVVADFEAHIKLTGGRVVVEPLPVVKGDPNQLHQLIGNLVANALKYRKEEVPPEVQVTGSLEREGTKTVVRISVRDNGIGFKADEAEKIFQPFVRLHGRQYEGSGIGLAICRRIVERHGGSIEAASVPGEGSVFTVTLPAA